MTPFRATTRKRVTWLADVLRAAGLEVVEHPGWETRGRTYPFQPVGVVLHHTASAPGRDTPSLGVVVTGRAEIPGPLCQVLIGRDARVHVIAAGPANHAGKGGPWHRIPRDLANRLTIGIEIEHTGTKTEPWDKQVVSAAATATAAITRHLGASTTYVLSHKEWAPTRKIDPYAWDMDAFRATVKDLVAKMNSARKAAANTTKKPAKKRTAPALPTIRLGAKGVLVRVVQVAAHVRPVDGVFGPDTQRGVRALQSTRHIDVDGIVGPDTWTVVLDALPALRWGSRGVAVRLAQTLLGMTKADVDGIYGRRTRANVRAWQSQRHVAATGTIKRSTWRTLTLKAR